MSDDIRSRTAALLAELGIDSCETFTHEAMIAINRRMLFKTVMAGAYAEAALAISLPMLVEAVSDEIKRGMRESILAVLAELSRIRADAAEIMASRYREQRAPSQIFSEERLFLTEVCRAVAHASNIFNNSAILLSGDAQATFLSGRDMCDDALSQPMFG